MATVTGLTAERMLEIEAASVVDGDVVGDHLILTKHDGTTVDAGSVRGPQGAVGPAGLSLVSVPTTPVLDVGLAGQIRAGRPLTLADFTTLCALPTPLVALFNLADLSNLGSAGALVNKGAVAFGVGITGIAAQAAQFIGSTAQALYIADTGAADPFRLSGGLAGYSIGCWFRTPKRGATQIIMSKMSNANSSPTNSWQLTINSANNSLALAHASGGSTTSIDGGMDVCDDRWHFAVATFDGINGRLYIDGVLAGIGALPAANLLAQPFNIGGGGGDGANASTGPFFGRIDEAFVSQDVLTDEQVRLLYCAKIPHGFGVTPKHVIVNVRRRRKGPLLASGDFPSQPLRLHNLNDLGDLGSNNAPLTANPGTGAITQVPGPDGVKGSGRAYSGAHTGDTATTAGLPSGAAPVTLGAWFKTTNLAAQYVVDYGDATTERYIWMNGGNLSSGDTASSPTGSPVADGLWHFAALVLDPAAADGLTLKAYLDGKLMTSDAVARTAVGLGGAGFFRIGAGRAGSGIFSGQIARVFVHGSPLTADQIRSLYAKGAQDLGASPKNPGDHVEAFDATNVYTAFDTLEQQYQVDMAVAA